MKISGTFKRALNLKGVDAELINDSSIMIMCCRVCNNIMGEGALLEIVYGSTKSIFNLPHGISDRSNEYITLLKILRKLQPEPNGYVWKAWYPINT
jgi:hypothetical protein